MEEVWRDIKDYEGLYQISSLGRVKSFKGKTSKIMIGNTNNRGYYLVGLRKDGKRKMFLRHRLVAQAFIPNPNNLPQVNHIDGNKSNNTLKNLEWVNQSENEKHAIKHNLRKPWLNEQNPMSKLKKCQVYFIRRTLRKEFSSKELADMFKITFGSIDKIGRRENWANI